MKAKLAMSLIKTGHCFLATLFLFTALTGCGGSSAPAACSGFDCQTSKFNLMTANLDGSNLVVIAKDTYREMTHPRITFDKKWIAYTRYNTRDAGTGCAEEKSPNGYYNTGIRAISMDGSAVVDLTTPDQSRFSTNNYWIGKTYNFTFLEGNPDSTDATNKIKIKRSLRDVNLGLISTDPIPMENTLLVYDPQQGADKIVFGGQYDITNPASDVKSIFTIDLNGTTASLKGITVATVYKGTTPVVATEAFENDPKFSPDGLRIAFMRKIATTNAANNHGFHIFVTSASGVPGSEVDISDQTIGQDVNFNDAVPEWINDTTLVFFTLNIVNGGLEQKLYTMKDDGTLRTEIPLPAGYYYSNVIPYQDAGQTKILFAAKKSSTSCTQ